MTADKKTEQQQKLDELDATIESLRSVIRPNAHLGADLMPGFMEVDEANEQTTAAAQPDIVTDEPALGTPTEGAIPSQGSISVPAPPDGGTTAQQSDERDTGAPLAEGLQSLAQAVDEQDKDLRTNYGAGTASDQGPPVEASEKSRRTMGGNTLR